MRLLHSTKELFMDAATKTERRAEPWNKGKLLDQKLPFPKGRNP